MTTTARSKPPGLNQTYCILVNSCDTYRDCWLPFFTLFNQYWRPYDHLIYLNTETESYAFAGLDIQSLAPNISSAHKLGWSGRLLQCLDAIPFDVVLYLQEDYFIENSVDVQSIDSFAELMQSENLSHISLERSATLTPGETSEYPFLSYIPQDADYRISAQAALWNVRALRSYLRRHESVWEWEWYGTRRAWRKPDSLLYVNPEYEAANGQKIIPYTPTGVAQGRWARDVVEDLFAAHNLQVDYTVRGFYDPHDAALSRVPLPRRVVRRLRSAL